MTKNELRAIYKAKRSALSLKEMDKLNDLILIHFQKIPLPFIACVHTYLASLRLAEPDTAHIIRYLQFKNPDVLVAVPRVDLSLNTMQHIHMSDNVELIKNSYGIEEPSAGNNIEPEDIDLVMVPLLAFDKAGFRVGYGKGFYDRFLKECKPGVVKIGLSFFDAEDSISDINELDVPLDYCVTPHQLYPFAHS